MTPTFTLTPAWPLHIHVPWPYLTPPYTLINAWPPHAPWPLHDLHIHPDPYMASTCTLTPTWTLTPAHKLTPAWPSQIPWPLLYPHMHNDPCLTFTCTLASAWPLNVPWPLHDPQMHLDPSCTLASAKLPGLVILITHDGLFQSDLVHHDAACFTGSILRGV